MREQAERFEKETKDLRESMEHEKEHAVKAEQDEKAKQLEKLRSD